MNPDAELRHLISQHTRMIEWALLRRGQLDDHPRLRVKWSDHPYLKFVVEAYLEAWSLDQQHHHRPHGFLKHRILALIEEDIRESLPEGLSHEDQRSSMEDALGKAEKTLGQLKLSTRNDRFRKAFPALQQAVLIPSIWSLTALGSESRIMLTLDVYEGIERSGHIDDTTTYYYQAKRPVLADKDRDAIGRLAGALTAQQVTQTIEVAAHLYLRRLRQGGQDLPVAQDDVTPSWVKAARESPSGRRLRQIIRDRSGDQNYRPRSRPGNPQSE